MRRSRTRPRKRFVSKTGRHGTLYLFRVKYTDSHVRKERFVESEDADGWRVLSVERVRARA